ncbi:MAG: alpha-D-ribose 1-methylphosphonate 5-triphosphate diphosphatase [Acidiphilium sp. 37-60-79]|nr:MAG: alpha-D-ribose 1-methylphosphonate 5-triphosphate diphosphatase [Acidiphilium sp. 37-60-79]
MTILKNARLILDDRVMTGCLALEAGIITRIDESNSRTGIDCEGDYLAPGIVDLHTDNLERQVLPRSNARWPSRSALLAHDAQCVAAGVTTVLDALCVGDIGFEQTRNETFRNGMRDLRALVSADLLKSDHHVHLRCELPVSDLPELLDSAIDDPRVKLVSVMDHSPGVGQYADIEKYRRMRRQEGHSPPAIDAMIARNVEEQERFAKPNRALVLELARARAVPVASHDAIAEFPVTLEAAQAARPLGMAIIAGAPNIVRGGSHSGNVAALDLVRAGLVDALASDYVPASMVEAAFGCVAHGVLTLPTAIQRVSGQPAAMVGLTDRGRIAVGLRADLVRIRLHGDLPIIRAVWRAGERVA